MKIGDELTFEIHGSTIIGTFISEENGLVKISTTFDSVFGQEEIGVEQDISKVYLV